MRQICFFATLLALFAMVAPSASAQSSCDITFEVIKGSCACEGVNPYSPQMAIQANLPNIDWANGEYEQLLWVRPDGSIVTGGYLGTYSSGTFTVQGWVLNIFTGDTVCVIEPQQFVVPQCPESICAAPTITPGISVPLHNLGTHLGSDIIEVAFPLQGCIAAVAIGGTAYGLPDGYTCGYRDSLGVDHWILPEGATAGVWIGLGDQTTGLVCSCDTTTNGATTKAQCIQPGVTIHVVNGEYQVVSGPCGPGEMLIVYWLPPGATAFLLRVSLYGESSLADQDLWVHAMHSPPTVALTGDTAVCVGDFGLLTATATGGTAPYTYSWSNGSTDTTASVTAGQHVVTVTDLNGCTAQDTMQIASLPGVTASVGFHHQCEPPAVLLTAFAEGIQPLDYWWDSGDDTPGFTATESGQHSVTVTGANGCWTTVTVNVTVPDQLTVLLSADRAHADQSDGRATVLVNGGLEAYSYVWSNSGTTQTITGLAAGTYAVTVTDANGCTASGQVVVDTIPVPPPANTGKDTLESIYFPNAFSPNGDGTNDWFTGYTTPGVATILVLQVYDRKGGLAFERYDLVPGDEAAGWDGTHRGKPVNSGVFAWVAEIEFLDGQRKKLHGDVTVVR